MGTNFVQIGNEVVVNLMNDTVTPETRAEGVTAHDAIGNVIVGTMPTDVVRYGTQTLTDTQKAQARKNIGVESIIADLLGRVETLENALFPAYVSEGLAFTLSDSGSYYTLTGMGTCTDTNIYIPALYKSIPVKIIGDRAFDNKAEVKGVHIPVSITSIGQYAFQACGFASITIPDNVTSMGHAVLCGIAALKSIDVGRGITTLANYVFSYCGRLETLILRANSLVPLPNGTIFEGSTKITNGTGYIYVPSALVNSYKSATNWSAYANQIRAIEDYPDITGG